MDKVLEKGVLIYVGKVPVDNIIMAIAFGKDLSATAEIDGTDLVIKNFNLETMIDSTRPQAARIPIVNGMVSQKEVDKALQSLGCFFD